MQPWMNRRQMLCSLGNGFGALGLASVLAGEGLLGSATHAATRGAGNPLALVYSRREARHLFKQFREVELRAYFLNKRFIPVVGNLLPRSIESALASRWGWHLWIYATK